LDAVASHVSRGEQLAVILTRQAAAVACAANRNNAVRAASTGSIDAVATVTRSMAANVLTIDPSQHSRHTLQAMTRQFLKAPTREIRTEFEGHV
jgi:ribose 5-phosphate isomerase RpiB